jgi:radical SAM protein with 4Fe4S-binding SPASM domain
MAGPSLHRIERDNRRFVLDTDTCFCFECDEISWDVLEYYPHTPTNKIVHLLRDSHPSAEVEEVVGELEWLRATKSILPVKKQADHLKALELTSGLWQIDVVLDGAAGDPKHLSDLCDNALLLLLGRANAQKALTFTLSFADVNGLEAWVEGWMRRALGCAKIAGKNLKIEIICANPTRKRADAVLEGHYIAVGFTFSTLEAVDSLAKILHAMGRYPISKLADVAADHVEIETAVRLTPGTANFCEGLDHLHRLGFKRIDLDLPGYYAQREDSDISGVVASVEAAAREYARQLLKGDYYRLEPIAKTFHQIYQGTARPRSDDSGTRILAIDGTGNVFPSRHFLGDDQFRIGNVLDATWDDSRRAPFDDLGILTTTPCASCWARNLCGGGHSAVHQALSGEIRQPDSAWCDAQRAWFGAAIAAFNLLSSEGVDFARLYQGIQPGKRPSLWGMARLAISMKVGLRPIEEADAALLTKWENWSESTYFLGNEYGLFLATCYDREMDSLHPRGIEREFMIVSRRGAPMGLLKVRPDQLPGVARIWVFFEDPAKYEDTGIRKNFKQILREAAKQDAFTTLLAASGPGDGVLGDFLRDVGFVDVGTAREALFLHDAYHDVETYSMTMGS